jgi:transcriptional regulator with XRE-family HTH domain
VPKSRKPEGPAEAFARQVAKVRESLGWSQGDLVTRMHELGVETKKGNPVDRATLARIESGKRRVTLEEVFWIAAALEIPPLLLMVPREAGSYFSVTPTFDVPAADARDWIVGIKALPGHDIQRLIDWAPELDPEVASSQYEVQQAQLEAETSRLIETAAQAVGSQAAETVRQVLQQIGRRGPMRLLEPRGKKGERQ